MKMTPFQLILTGIFAVLILLGVGIFATKNSSSGGGPVGPVTLWGTAGVDTMEALLATLRQSDKVSFESVVYVEKNPSTFTSELVNAMATGNGPDLFLVSDADVSTFADKITPIPYSAVSQRDFTDAFIDEGQLFLTTQGALALPFSVDPWIMYWNRDLFASAGVAKPPTYWNDFLDMAPRLTSLDASGNIKKSAVALGEWSNVVGAKNIMALLLLQAGDAIVVRGETGALVSVLGRTPEGVQENPAASALQFYTEFANPSKTIYSWNRSLPNSQNSFVAGDLAVYLGPASDYPTITNRNPNLHFGVALVPQIEGNAVKLTFGRLTGVAISDQSLRQNGL
jgi:ABC-type glycerol-3-phosphate transport system substrate-binding protein